jgi:hypothetical protein
LGVKTKVQLLEEVIWLLYLANIMRLKGKFKLKTLTKNKRNQAETSCEGTKAAGKASTTGMGKGLFKGRNYNSVVTCESQQHNGASYNAVELKILQSILLVLAIYLDRTPSVRIQ